MSQIDISAAAEQVISWQLFSQFDVC